MNIKNQRSTHTGRCTLFSLLIITIIFFSCGTISPIQGQEFVSYPTIEAISPGWQPLYTEIKGIDYFTGKISKPKLEFHALRIDLSEPHLEIFIAPGGPACGKAGGKAEVAGEKFSSIKVSSFVRNNSLLAGINALPFEPSSDKEGEARENIGIVIAGSPAGSRAGGGIMLSKPHPKFDALVFYPDKNAAIIPQLEIISNSTAYSAIENAVGGFYAILKDSEPLHRSDDRHPRSAAGISGGGWILYLLVVDGRRPGSIGSTELETALILKAIGAIDGINLDGGGSSALALLFHDGQVRVLNTPVHGGIPGKERAVAGCIGIRLKIK